MLLRAVRPALSLLVALTVMLGLVYPVVITGIARVAFPDAAAGSLVVHDSKVVGSRLIGQAFTDPKYFWGRPSATSPQPYNALASSGSNLGPLNPALIDNVKAGVASLRAADPEQHAAVPVELVTASASGLDPEISPTAAAWQAGRVARARGMPLATVQALVAAHTSGPLLGILGESRVNVLELNLALDAQR
jgi:potassium-transporting ATPase KdpC subunit